MTVREYDRIDQLTVRLDGRLRLAMTEDRNYGNGSDESLTEDFRRKLNAYLGAVRAGEVYRMARRAGVKGDKGIEIVLFSATEPTSMVFEMLKAVNSSLGGEQIAARWESLEPTKNRSELIEQAVVDEAIKLLESGWKFALLWVSMVGREGGAGMQVVLGDEAITNVELPDTLRGLLFAHKQATHDRVCGAWLSGQIRIAPPSRYETSFSWSSVPEWVPTPSVQDVRQELADYPRAPAEIPSWMRISDGW
ncbi:hypothetical protein [Nocardia goodfellowii]|uniref:Uncharacterized protein n=1 Tax=Nocardia goodfellowii TaxID=882446 RepID=A0ABS4QRL1_9NOCA|nr:hypothetical protein [Nocardia goodfellowii]MBP2194312.1 hypothetical protein [Nocardia goodfellowii]